MWLTIFIIMSFIYVSLGIVTRIINIYNFFTNSDKQNKTKNKLVE